MTKGIWELKVRTDGVFQAKHEGDIFAYRFAGLGYGRRDAFRPVDLGEPDFSSPLVIGNTVRWSEVFDDVDVTIRYLHDIMKVDVILKREFMNDLRVVVNAGELNSDEYLTARFDVLEMQVSSEIMQAGRFVDGWFGYANTD